MSKIEWTNETWNPTVGCNKVSPGCQNCYAIKDQYRMAKNPNPKISKISSGLTEKRGNRLEWTGQVKFLRERLEQPLHWRKPRMIFVNSQSDLFHETIADEQLDQIFAVMALTPQHTYQVLTKRPERMAKYMNWCERRHKANGKPISFCRVDAVEEHMAEFSHAVIDVWPLPNVWLGVTVENQQAVNERIPFLLQTPAAIRFLSCEPLLEKVDLEKAFAVIDVNGEPFGPVCDPDGSDNIGWVIAGGESGHSARFCDIDWIQSIVDQCNDFDVPCFVKQLGSNPVTQKEWAVINGAPLNMVGSKYSLPNITGKGGNPDEWPASLRIRQFPKAF